MKRSDIAPVGLLMATTALLGAALYYSAPARADGHLDRSEVDYVLTYGAGAVCPVIDEYHNAAGVAGVMRAIEQDGFSADSAVDIINTSVAEYCPRNWPLLHAIGNAARASSAANTKVA